MIFNQAVARSELIASCILLSVKAIHELPELYHLVDFLVDDQNWVIIGVAMVISERLVERLLVEFEPFFIIKLDLIIPHNHAVTHFMTNLAT